MYNTRCLGIAQLYMHTVRLFTNVMNYTVSA